MSLLSSNIKCIISIVPNSLISQENDSNINQPTNTHTHTQTQVLMSPDAGKERVGKNGADYHLRVLIVRRSVHIIQNIILFVMMIQTLVSPRFGLIRSKNFPIDCKSYVVRMCFEFDPLSLQHNKTGTHTSLL